MVELDTNLKMIKKKATWWDEDFYKLEPMEKALKDVEEGYAFVISPNTIMLTKKKKSIRKMVLERDNCICYFCGNYGDTLEHLLPISKGGKTNLENCVCACKKCNEQKGNMTESQYQKWLNDQHLKEEKYRKLMMEIFSSPRN